MAKKFTAASVAAFKAGGGRREVADSGCPGLYVVIQPGGRKSFALRFRSPVERDGKGQRKAKKLTLGPFSDGSDKVDSVPAIGRPLTLAGARSLANAALDEVARGIDPTHKRRATRQAEKHKAIAAAEDNVEVVFEKFMKRYAEVKTRESSWRETQRIFDTRIEPKWRGRSVQHILKRDVLDLLDGVMDDGAPILANRVLAVVRRFFNWTVERDILSWSPCAGVERPAEETSRDRVLTDIELGALWKAADDEGAPYGAIVKMLILTGQRVGEVRELPAGKEIDVKDKIWRLPEERTKNGRASDVPLSAAALAVLKSVPRIKDAKFVFTSTGSTPFSAMSASKARVDTALLNELRKADPKAKLPHWRLHDLRRTVATNLQKLGFPVEVVEAVLNHKSGTVRGVAAIYARHDYAAEKRAALDAWAKHVERLISPPGENVSRLIR